MIPNTVRDKIYEVFGNKGLIWISILLESTKYYYLYSEDHCNLLKNKNICPKPKNITQDCFFFIPWLETSDSFPYIIDLAKGTLLKLITAPKSITSATDPERRKLCSEIKL